MEGLEEATIAQHFRNSTLVRSWSPTVPSSADARSLQAGRETLSATLTPSIAAGGAAGEPVHEVPGSDSVGDQHLLQRCKLALQGGDPWRPLGYRQGALAMRSTSVMTRLSIRSANGLV